MNRPEYGEIPELWEIEGSLRDVYVLETGLADWRRFIAYVAGYVCTYSFDGNAKLMPAVEQLLERRDGSHLLRIQIGEATANCHFFTTSEIELDLDPREVRSPKAHDEVLGFIEGLANALGKPALLSPEDGAHVPYLSYTPAGRTWRTHA